MLPAVPTAPQAEKRRLPRAAWLAGAALAGLAAMPAARAQDGPPPAPPPGGEAQDGTPGAGPDAAADDLLRTPAPPAPASPPAGQDGPGPDAPTGPNEIAFETDTLSYDSTGDVVTASGNVVLRSADRSVRADEVTWNRATGQIVGRGNVRFVDEEGNQLYTSRIELTDEFEAGAMEDLLLALREGGRLAAEAGARGDDGTVILSRAAYTACAVEDAAGCPKDPSWRVTADRVVYDPADNRVRFTGAYLEIFGARLLPLPGLAIRTDGRAVSGFLVPDLRVSESNGVEVSGSYYWRVADNKDLTLGAHVFTEAPPMASAQWRHLTGSGAYQITGYATHSSRISDFTGAAVSESDPRGYLFANGRFQFDPHWSLTGSLRLASDRTFLRRYDISRDDRLRSTFDVERIDDDSYLSIAGWATQTLRIGVPQGEVPVALPVIDYRRRLADPAGLGGTLEFQLNSLAIMRDEGQDTRRAFAGARWDLKRITGLGQVVTLTGMVRGDVYHSDENALTETAVYRGNPGWETRGIAVAAIDVEWPFVGELLGGTQVFTPRVQFAASPPIRNLDVPNEDSRAIDLEDSNLFALNRFPGYDRVEDGARVTYGFDWELQVPDWRVRTTVGQTYRFDKDPGVFIDGTGLSERVSDFVGRTEVRFRDFLSFTHRFRLDKDNFAVRRNELDASIGSKRTYAEIGYLRLDRDIAEEIEDLQDREELRLATRIAFARYWSIFGAGVFNLTDRQEDPTLTSDGFDPVRTRLGIAYEDDCLELGVTWRRDYTDAGDARRGDTFQFYFALRNLGFR
ncbi:LPS-assembly protein LptD [Pelagerythrobacter marinus]|uniref:LPS-assembly protein LptD n=1 Tax=Pelagerythrobacter marinus TaxID=538382 RepID=UPI002036B9BB|nr:LPS assembly protein LptD [Pelagerythrobacter marinus]USA38609.1 LPS assembly protein LptD [Pelagerythrobacter marinus]WPZ07365.1 LPS assembly protein LptD [Pelagerythrobacter marinus]